MTREATGVPTVPRWGIATTVAVLLLSTGGTLLGLLQRGFYRDPAALAVQAYGQDLVTLVVVVPLLAGGLRFAVAGSLRGYVVWLGSLGYLLYTYAVYAVVTEFNAFFLGYVALFGLSLYTFVGGLLRLDPAVVERRLDGRLPVRATAGFLVGMGVLVAVLWLSEIVPATLAGTKPESVAALGLPANVVHVLDLAVLVPALFVTARWLRQGRAWGYVLPGVLFVKLTAIGLAVLGMIVWLTATGQPPAMVEVVVFGVLTLANAAFGLVYLRALHPAAPTTDARGPAAGA